MSADVKGATDRVRTFIAARERHRSRLFPGRNPMPNLICAEYGTLDVDDLAVLCDAAEGKT